MVISGGDADGKLTSRRIEVFERRLTISLRVAAHAAGRAMENLAGEEIHRPVIAEVLPKTGLVYSEKGNLTEVLSKPKLMPLKSSHQLRVEKLEKDAMEAIENKRAETAAQRQGAA